MKTTVNEQGQVAIPEELRHEMQLAPGSTVLWEKVSSTEWRLRTEAEPLIIKGDPVAALGFAQRHGLPAMTTDEYMKLIREGEED